MTKRSGFDFFEIVYDKRIENENKKKRHDCLHDCASERENVSVELKRAETLDDSRRVVLGAEQVVAFAEESQIGVPGGRNVQARRQIEHVQAERGDEYDNENEYGTHFNHLLCLQSELDHDESFE